MFDRFSGDARNVMVAARVAAQQFGHDYIGTEHILLGVIATDGGAAATALRKLGIDLARIPEEVGKTVRRGTHEGMHQLPFTPRGKRVLELSLQEAQEAGHGHIGTGHLLLGLVREGEGIAAQVLGRLGLTLDKARPVVLDVMREATDAHDGPPTPGPRLSVSLSNVLKEACAAAASEGRTQVEPEDALLAMVGGDGIAARLLRELGATPEGVRSRIMELRGR